MVISSSLWVVDRGFNMERMEEEYDTSLYVGREMMRRRVSYNKPSRIFDSSIRPSAINLEMNVSGLR